VEFLLIFFNCFLQIDLINLSPIYFGWFLLRGSFSFYNKKLFCAHLKIY
jgi:hypothetical protein